MKFEAVIFDLDGVICFTDEYHYLAWKAMADNIGVYFCGSEKRAVQKVSFKDVSEGPQR